MLFVCAAFIGVATLWYTEGFLDELRDEEVKKVRQFSEAIGVTNAADNNTDVTLPISIIKDNTTIPLIIVDNEGEIVTTRNLPEGRENDKEWLKRKMKEMEQEIKPIEVIFLDKKNTIYYQNSTLLTKLRYYPVVLLVVISLFVVIAYIAFSNARKAEQNQVWNGLAKETAHQIGTPLTSLVGWVELLKDKEVDQNMVDEMEKDIYRLNTITDRFSKIGSKPSIKQQNIVSVTQEAVSYLKARSSKRVNIQFSVPDGLGEILIDLNKPLFEWVIENLIRNAIDAIEGEGQIRVSLTDYAKYVRIDVEDNGKGIPQNKQKTIFRPGYTTKSRGWGLGLSLAKRIIEDYHNGRIYVVRSEVGKGSIFRVQLKKPG